MSNKKNNSELRITNYELRTGNSLEGFTLIELILAVSLIVIVSAVSMIGFTQYNDAQQLRNAALNVMLVLQQAKSKAQSQVKPDNIAACVTNRLESYRVQFTSTTYELNVVCASTATLIQSKQLPLGITINPASTAEFNFMILNGSVNQGSVTINRGAAQTTITVDKMGNIK